MSRQRRRCVPRRSRRGRPSRRARCGHRRPPPSSPHHGPRAGPLGAMMRCGQPMGRPTTVRRNPRLIAMQRLGHRRGHAPARSNESNRLWRERPTACRSRRRRSPRGPCRPRRVQRPCQRAPPSYHKATPQVRIQRRIPRSRPCRRPPYRQSRPNWRSLRPTLKHGPPPRRLPSRQRRCRPNRFRPRRPLLRRPGRNASSSGSCARFPSPMMPRPRGKDR